MATRNKVYSVLTSKDDLYNCVLGEPKSGGHLTITHQMLASIILVLYAIILPRSDKTWWEILGKMLLAYYHIS